MDMVFLSDSGSVLAQEQIQLGSGCGWNGFGTGEDGEFQRGCAGAGAFFGHGGYGSPHGHGGVG
jgi:hypothetical protein